MKYNVKIGLGIRYLFFGIFLYFLGIMIFFAIEQEISALISMLFILVFIMSIVKIAYYKLEDDHIYMRVSLFYKRIKYEDIIQIRREKRTRKSTFALSSDRIVIKLGNKRIFNEYDISPADIEEVFDELKRRCKNLKEEN